MPCKSPFFTQLGTPFLQHNARCHGWLPDLRVRDEPDASTMGRIAPSGINYLIPVATRPRSQQAPCLAGIPTRSYVGPHASIENPLPMPRLLRSLAYAVELYER